MPEHEADCLVIVWDHQLSIDGDWIDPVWTEIRSVFGVKPNKDTEPFRLGFNSYLNDLWLQKLRQQERDKLWLLQPEVYPYKSGDLLTVTQDSTRLILFHATVRLNTGGPTMPALRAMEDLIGEIKPKLVLSVGLGGGVIKTDVAGDVVISSKACFKLREELASSPNNDQEFGGRWELDQNWFSDVQLEALKEPSLVAPSLNYEDPTTSIDPTRTRKPQILIRQKPVLTMPRLTEHGFVIPGYKKSRFYGDDGAAVEMDAAAAARACGDTTDFGAVVGLTMPPIRSFSHDYQSSLRDGWAELFISSHAGQAARNVARVVERICRGAFGQQGQDGPG